jgi:hypothetical protein
MHCAKDGWLDWRFWCERRCRLARTLTPGHMISYVSPVNGSVKVCPASVGQDGLAFAEGGGVELVWAEVVVEAVLVTLVGVTLGVLIFVVLVVVVAVPLVTAEEPGVLVVVPAKEPGAVVTVSDGSISEMLTLLCPGVGTLLGAVFPPGKDAGVLVEAVEEPGREGPPDIVVDMIETTLGRKVPVLLAILIDEPAEKLEESLFSTCALLTEPCPDMSAAANAAFPRSAKTTYLNCILRG